MDIRKLELFADVAETGNFTKTGERMGYTQSGVSHILKSLENEVGFPLFIRIKQGVRLTRNAELLLPLVRSLLDANKKLIQTIDDINGIDTGNLVIASFPSISIHWLPAILRRYQTIYPDISVSLIEGGTDDIVSCISENIADFGLLSKRNVKDLEWIPLCSEHMMAVLPLDYPAPEDGVFPLSGFQGQDLVLSAKGYDYDIYYVLDMAGITPNINFTSKNDHAILTMIANHLGIGIMPELALRGYENIVKWYPLDPCCCRELGIAVKSRQEMSPAAKKFLGLTQQMLTDKL